jgi:predicted metalloenzyme YecM
MSDPVGDIIGDYRGFVAQQHERLLARGIDIRSYTFSHLCFRVAEWEHYVHVRTMLERHATANREKLWNGRPISLIDLATPLEVLDGMTIPNIELIPPVHQRVYKMGMEHVGVVIGEGFEAFSRQHRPVLTGQQFQSADVDPVYVLFEDFSHVKFYRESFIEVVKREEGPFEGFVHVDDWIPNRLVTATGPNPLPR